MLLALLAFAAAPTLQSQAQELFANQSANPSAAQFRNVRIVGGAVCGEVNKPNRSGGYDGFQRFLYRSGTTWVLETAGDYRLQDGGSYIDTAYLSRRADRAELSVGTELLRQANAVSRRARELLATCL